MKYTPEFAKWADKVRSALLEGTKEGTRDRRIAEHNVSQFNQNNIYFKEEYFDQNIGPKEAIKMEFTLEPEND